jgi:GLPGLI family protein
LPTAWAFLCIIGTEFRFYIKTFQMKKLFTLTALLLTIYFASFSQDVKTISDCTVTYDVSVQDANADPGVVKIMAGATKVLYLKGAKTRSDLTATGFKQTTIYDAKSDSTVVLRESGNSKYISYLDNTKRKVKNRKFDGIQFSNTNEKKTILGYDCVKVVAKLTDGSTYNVYYTPSIMPSNTGYEYQFRDLPGFVLEYEELSEDGKTKVKYSASKISLVPVPIAKFDVPKSGYRVL